MTLMMAAAKGGLPVPGNNIVVGVGDSLTVASANTGGATYTTPYLLRTLNTTGNVGGYLAWAAILPKTGDTAGDGRFRFGGSHATGGLTTAQVLTNHVNGADSPLNDTPKPGMAAVLTGTNDLGTVAPAGVLSPSALATWKASLQTIYQTLITGGILPVACKLPPNGVANNQVAVTAMNTEIGNLATALGLPLADLFTPCATGTNWTAGYNVDNDHPTVTGAKAMGQALRDAVDSKLPATTPNLVTTATEAGAGVIFLNGCCQRDTDVDNVPDGGYTAEAAGYWTQTVNGAVWTLAVRAGYSGKAWRWNKTSDAVGDSQCQGTGAGGTFSPVLTDGHLYEIGLTAEVASWSDTQTYLQVAIWKVSDASKNPFTAIIRKDAGFSSAVARFVLSHTFRCESVNAPAGTYRWNIVAGGAQAANLIDCYLGQITLRDVGVG